jgi:predicted ABC-type ATPase
MARDEPLKRLEADNTRVLLVFAGPNGSGKSTVTQEILNDPRSGFDGQYINADEIAKSLEERFPIRTTRERHAAELATQLRNQFLNEGRTFAFESVLSTPGNIALMTQAKARSYEINLVFVTTERAEINVARVLNRVAQGGHPVPDDKIRERYDRTMDLLPVAIEHADVAVVYDNSRDGLSALRVAQKFRGDRELALVPTDAMPAWVEERLMRPYVHRLASLASLAIALKGLGYEDAPHVEVAEAKHGLSYEGVVVAQSSMHVLMKAEADRFMVHDRALMQERVYQVGQPALVTYAYEGGKIMPLERERDRER